MQTVLSMSKDSILNTKKTHTNKMQDINYCHTNAVIVFTKYLEICAFSNCFFGFDL